MLFTGTTFILILVGVVALVICGVLFYKWIDRKDRQRMGGGGNRPPNAR